MRQFRLQYFSTLSTGTPSDERNLVFRRSDYVKDSMKETIPRFRHMRAEKWHVRGL